MFTLKKLNFFLLVLWIFFATTVTVALALTGHYNLNHYTFVSFSILTLFFTLLFIGFLFWVHLYWFLMIWILPIINGSVWVVFSFSSMLIGDNGNIFLRTTKVQSGNLTVGQAHTGDIVIHFLPVIVVLLLEFLNWSLLRVIVVSRHKAQRWLYFFYFIFSPLLPITIYGLFERVDVQYPSNIDFAFASFIIVSLVFASNSILYLSLLSTTMNEEEEKSDDLLFEHIN